MTSSLYRHFDREQKLLYVGVSISAVKRLGEHALHSHWHSQIANVTIEHFETRKEAIAAEKEAIESEKPLHNIAHNKSKKDRPLSEYERQLEARRNLYSRTVNFKPLYSVKEAAQTLALSPHKVTSMIVAGELGGYAINTVTRIVNGEEQNATKWAVSGWHIIDYIEALERRQKKDSRW